MRFVPKSETVVLGTISTKPNELEPIGGLGEASRYIGTDQFCLSSQLGFASNFAVNRFSFGDQKRKLAHLVETADRIWA